MTTSRPTPDLRRPNPGKRVCKVPVDICGFSAAIPRSAIVADRPVHLLVFASLYPNAVQPRHGIFVEERLRKLVASGRVSATVVAPVPWFPFASARLGTYSQYARVPAREERNRIAIVHPRYPVIPKVGMNVAPALMYRALLPVLRGLIAAGNDFDVIDAHYFYPDGVAAARLAAVLRKPVVISARGSDINWIARYRSPRRQIQAAAKDAAAIVTVSHALNAAVVALGVDPRKVMTLRNGVDLECFRPGDRAEIRAELGLTGPTWLTVGHLIESKGVHLAIAALAHTSDVTLLIAGEGPEGRNLHELAGCLGLAPRVRVLGAVSHDVLWRYYNAADALVLPSSREGMPNVALEALACGTPVVAAPFAGAAEVVTAPVAGEIASERGAGAIAAAWSRLQSRAPSRADTRRFAERRFGWEPVVEAQCALYARARSGWTGGRNE